MAVPTTTLAVSYDGNGSTVIPYPIPFPFLDVGHVYAGVTGEYVHSIGAVDALAADMTGFVYYFYDIPEPRPASGDFLRGADGILREVESINYNSELGSTIVMLVDRDLITILWAGGEEIELVKAGGTPIALPASAYTVTRLPDGSGGSLVTKEPVDEHSAITIFRQVPLTQPTVFQPAGPFPAKTAETAYDRLLMICQQLNRRLNTLEGVDEPDYIYIPSSAPDETRDTKSWATDTARGAVVPNWAGQLGVQRDSQTIWIAASTGVGSWVRFRDHWQKEYRAVAPTTVVGTSDTFYLGTLSKETFIKSVFISTVEEANSEIDVQLFAGDVQIAVVTIEVDKRTGSAVSEIPTFGIPEEAILTASVTNTGYAPGSRLGLDVIFECAAS